MAHPQNIMKWKMHNTLILIIIITCYVYIFSGKLKSIVIELRSQEEVLHHQEEYRKRGLQYKKRRLYADGGALF